MLRPFYPRAELSIAKAIADLTAVLAETPPYSPEARKLAEIIRRLRGEEDTKADRPRG